MCKFPPSMLCVKESEQMISQDHKVRRNNKQCSPNSRISCSLIQRTLRHDKVLLNPRFLCGRLTSEKVHGECDCQTPDPLLPDKDKSLIDNLTSEKRATQHSSYRVMKCRYSMMDQLHTNFQKYAPRYGIFT